MRNAQLSAHSDVTRNEHTHTHTHIHAHVFNGYTKSRGSKYKPLFQIKITLKLIPPSQVALNQNLINFLNFVIFVLCIFSSTVFAVFHCVFFSNSSQRPWFFVASVVAAVVSDVAVVASSSF